MPPAPDRSASRGEPALDLPYGPLPARPAEVAPPDGSIAGATDAASEPQPTGADQFQAYQRQGSESVLGGEASSGDHFEHRPADRPGPELAGEPGAQAATESGQSDVQSSAEFDVSPVDGAEEAGQSRMMTPQEAGSGSAATPEGSEPEQAAAWEDSESLQAQAPEDFEDEGEAASGQSTHLEVAPGSPEVDDDVHFGVAAKALGVSRKTVERMVKNGNLDRGPSGAPATVSKRALVAIIEERRGKTAQPLGSSDLEAGAVVQLDSQAGLPLAGVQEIQALLGPLLEPLLQELVAVRTQAAVLENQISSIDSRAAHEQESQAEHERRQNELLLALITGNWLQRRKARKFVVRAMLRRDSPPSRHS